MNQIVTPEMCQTMAEMREKGYMQKDIAAHLGIHPTSVFQWLERIDQRGMEAIRRTYELRVKRAQLRPPKQPKPQKEKGWPSFDDGRGFFDASQIEKIFI